jgi:photosystem II stability/assembly factor-like uncharacterized protein
MWEEPSILSMICYKMKKISLIAAALFVTVFLQAQPPRIEILTKDTKTSLRGLSVATDNIVWVSGSNGTVGRSSNGGKNWKWLVVKGFEKTEFRDIEAFDANTAIIMAVGEPAYILKTIDGGDSWKVVYENKTRGMFLDAMDFANTLKGIVVGDPVNGKIFMARTDDNGNTWQEIQPEQNKIVPDSGEAFFASSGSNIRLFANNEYFIVSGGKRSRFISRSGAMDLPIVQGKESTGANSIDIYDNGIPDEPGLRMVIVGGDFAADSVADKNCLYSTNAGKSWHAPRIPPHGYRSCVEFLSKKDLLACGLTGVDYSPDGGRTWKWISKESFNTCRIARIGTSIYLAGNNGKVARVSVD